MGSATNRAGSHGFDPSLPFHVSPPAAPGGDLDPIHDPRVQTDIARTMVEKIIELQPKTGAEALRELRSAFPNSPLALRVVALSLLMRRAAQNPSAVRRPR